MGKPALDMQTILGFNEARDEGVAVGSDGTFAICKSITENHTVDRQPYQHLKNRYFAD